MCGEIIARWRSHNTTKTAPNLIRDSSLAPIIRWKLLQPLVGGPGLSDLPPDELFGWAVLLDPRRPGPPGAGLAGPSKKHRHNDVVNRIGRIGAAATRQSLVTEHSRAMDSWKLADPEATTDIHHSPDFVLVDPQGRATLFDFTQPRPITRVNGRMVNYCDLEHGAYLKVAEKKKRESHWRFVRHQFAGMASFVPLAMDWDGAFGDTFSIGQTAKWTAALELHASDWTTSRTSDNKWLRPKSETTLRKSRLIIWT